MMKNIFAIAILIAAGVAIGAQARPELKTVASVDLNKYAGKWYEIAKYPNKFQKQCVGNTTATYSLKPNGKIEVLNECLTKDGTVDAAKGEAKIADTATNAKLKVRFAPKFISFLPMVWGDYWIMDLEPNYDYVVIGEPKREYFWVLSRKPEMDDATFQAILRRAEEQGFNPAKVERSRQGVETIKGGVINRPN
ncbi:lipocalin family protein [soil metagenome]